MRWVTSVSPAPADGHHRWTRRGHDTGIARLQPCDDDDDGDEDSDGVDGDSDDGDDDDSGDVDEDNGNEILIV